MSVTIFISTVTAEFQSYREALRHDLTRPDVEVKVEEDFKPLGLATLEQLDLYIARCDLVVHFVGDMTGADANEVRSVARIQEMHPDLIDKLPPLKQALDEGESLSYTQWEAWLAHYHGKALLVVRPTEAAPRGPNNKPTDESRRAQAEHLRRLEGYETYPAITFANNDDLAKQLAYSAILDLLAKARTPRADKPKNLPYASLGSLFKGRDEFLARLRASLQKPGGGKAAIVSGALYGMGGVGKTRAAVEYALAHENDYVALLFATGETPASLRANIAALAGVLRLAEASATEQEAQYEAAIGWLNRNPGWLLILDNIDSKAALAEANKLLGRLSGGHVVMTSRLTGFGGEVEPLHLDVLTEAAAAEFLLERTAKGRKPAPDDATRARDLGRNSAGSRSRWSTPGPISSGDASRSRPTSANQRETSGSTACSSCWRTTARISTISRSPPGVLSMRCCRARKAGASSTKGAPLRRAPGLR